MGGTSYRADCVVDDVFKFRAEDTFAPASGLYLHIASGGIIYQSKYEAQKRNIELSSLHILSLSTHSWSPAVNLPTTKTDSDTPDHIRISVGPSATIHVNRRSHNILFPPCCAILNRFDSNYVCFGLCFSFQLTDLLRWLACLLSHSCTRIVSMSTGPNAWPSPHERS